LVGADILDYLRQMKAGNPATAVVLAPIGFISDHMEVLYDLDVESAAGLRFVELANDAGEDGGRAPEIHRHDSGTDSGADEPGGGEAGVGVAGGAGGCLCGGVLSGRKAVVSGQI